MSITAADIKRAIAHAKQHEVGTIYVSGERHYVWVRGRGWVKPGPHKAKMRKQRAKR